MHRKVARPGLKDSEKRVLQMQTQRSKDCYPSDIVGTFPSHVCSRSRVSRKDRTSLECLCPGAKGWGLCLLKSVWGKDREGFAAICHTGEVDTRKGSRLSSGRAADPLLVVCRGSRPTEQVPGGGRVATSSLGSVITLQRLLTHDNVLFDEIPAALGHPWGGGAGWRRVPRHGRPGQQA